MNDILFAKLEGQKNIDNCVESIDPRKVTEEELDTASDLLVRAQRFRAIGNKDASLICERAAAKLMALHEYSLGENPTETRTNLLGV